MVQISANNGNVRILQITKNLDVDKSHKKVFQNHLNACPETYSKVKGIIWDSSSDLALDVSFSNAKKSAQIFIALVDELGEYFSIDALERCKGRATFDMKVSEKQIKITKKITLLLAKQFEDNSVSNAKIYEFTIANFLPLHLSSLKGNARG